jgi:hypothetical protein
VFESCDLRANIGAEFESEQWSYDILTTRIKIRSESFRSPDDLISRVVHLLTETQEFFTPRKLPYLTVDRVLVRGLVPEEKGKDVAAILRTKLLPSRLRQGREGTRLVDLLPGTLAGTGLTLEYSPITDEINAHPRQVARLKKSREQVRKGEVHWGIEDEDPSKTEDGK